MSSSTTGHSAHSSERPERSRNAKAQARHRAKRKAYIEQLETTVTKLQTALGFSPEDIANLPAPMARIQDLEDEVERLRHENTEMRRLLGQTSSGSSALDTRRRFPVSGAYADPRMGDHDSKRRRMVSSTYSQSPAMTDSSNPSSEGLLNTRPPPLTIPQPQHYSQMPHPNSAHSQSSSLYNAHGSTAYQINTPSGSSSGSSPPFSPTEIQHAHSPVQHRHRPNSQHQNSIAEYTQSNLQYGAVKVEEEQHYQHSPVLNHHPPVQQPHYSLPPFSQTVLTPPGMDNWHSYPQRPPLHH